MVAIMVINNAAEHNRQTVNNWAFNEDCINLIMSFNFKSAPDHGIINTEIAKARRLLELYKTAYNIKSNHGLFISLQKRQNFEQGIDFEYFVQYLVFTKQIILTGNINSVTRDLYRQSQHDRFYFYTEHLLQSKIEGKFLRRNTLYDLENHVLDIAHKDSKKRATHAANHRWEIFKEKEKRAIKIFKNDYKKHGKAIFSGCKTYYDKLKYIQDHYNIEKGHRIGEAKAAQWYSKVCVKKQRTSKPNTETAHKC